MRLRARPPQPAAADAERTRQSPAPGRPWFTRGLAFGVVILLHFVIFALLTLEAQRPPAATPPSAEMVSLMLGAPGAPATAKDRAAPSPPSPPTPPVPPAPSPSPSPAPSPLGTVETAKSDPAPAPPVMQPVSQESALATSGPAGAQSGGCNLERQLQDRLVADPAIVSSLEHMPPGARSVANAVQLWDGRWITPVKLQPPELLDPVKVAIFQTVAASKAACLTAPIQGPRLIFVPVEGRTFIISLGSGAWRWADVKAPGLEP